MVILSRLSLGKGFSRVEPARRVPLAAMGDRFGEDVERGEHEAVLDEQHRERPCRGVVRRRGLRPLLAMQRVDLRA